MKSNLYILLIFCGISFSGCSQKLQPEDELSRRNAERIAGEIFSNETKGKEYIIFSVAEKSYLIIVQGENSYEEYFYNSVSKKTKHTIIKKPNELFNKMFNKSIYHKEYITFDSDFFKPHYEISSGSITYFVYKMNSQRLGEARLSFFIKPNPIDSEIYLYLTEKIIEYSREIKT